MSRAERRRRTRAVILRRHRVLVWARMLPGLPGKRFSEVPSRAGMSDEDRETLKRRRAARLLGRCRTLHPFDCGRPRCGICSWYKRSGGDEPRQVLVAKLSFREQLREHNANVWVERRAD